jgi:hypothetical protein
MARRKYSSAWLHFDDITDHSFGRLMARWPVGINKKRTFWLCSCVCGNNKIVTLSSLRNGDTKSCGCIRREKTIARNLERAPASRARLLSGQAIGMNPRTHGMSRSKEYKAFAAAMGRCRNPRDSAFHHYGGRGIEFRFKNFNEWLEVLGPKPEPVDAYSADRINNNGHYEPGNVRWATRVEQYANRRVKMITEFSLQELKDEIRRRGSI